MAKVDRQKGFAKEEGDAFLQVTRDRKMHWRKMRSPWVTLAHGVRAAGLALAIMLTVGCADGEPSAATAPQSAPTAEVATNTTAATSGTLSVNNASIAELTAAFEAAGIGSARRWAREVDEYRPYSVDDTNYTKLRGELAKYNPAPGVVETIIAQLHLP